MPDYDYILLKLIDFSENCHFGWLDYKHDRGNHATKEIRVYTVRRAAGKTFLLPCTCSLFVLPLLPYLFLFGLYAKQNQSDKIKVENGNKGSWSRPHVVNMTSTSRPSLSLIQLEPGMQFNRHWGLRVGFRNRFREDFMDNFGTRGQ